MYGAANVSVTVVGTSAPRRAAPEVADALDGVGHLDGGLVGDPDSACQPLNCDSSVEPPTAVVSDSPPVIAIATSSK